MKTPKSILAKGMALFAVLGFVLLSFMAAGTYKLTGRSTAKADEIYPAGNTFLVQTMEDLSRIGDTTYMGVTYDAVEPDGKGPAANYTQNGYYMLYNDIKIDRNYVPYCRLKTTDGNNDFSQSFKGTFNGQRYDGEFFDIIYDDTEAMGTNYDAYTGGQPGFGIFGCVGEYIDNRSTPFAYLKNITIRDINISVVSQGSGIGALAGKAYNIEVENCKVIGGSVTGNYQVGGMFGAITGMATQITNSYATCDVSYNTAAVDTQTNYGGFAGMLAQAKLIKNCYATGNVRGKTSTGGFLGAWNGAGYDNAIWRGTVENCFSTGDVDGVLAAGFSLSLRSNKQGLDVRNCYSTSNVTSRFSGTGTSNNAGGFTCLMDNATITNCYYAGDYIVQTDAAAHTYTAGFGGKVTQDCTAVLTGCISFVEDIYCSGGTPAYPIGNFIGQLSYRSTITMTDCYYVKAAGVTQAIALTDPGASVTGAPVEKTAAELDDAFLESIGYDYNTVWGSDPGINGGYPYLLDNPPPLDDSLFTITVNGGTGGGAYADQAEAVLTANAAADGYEFIGWRKGAEGAIVDTNETYSFTVTESAEYTAEYAKIEYGIIYSVGDNGINNAGNPEKYTIGTEFTFLAPEREGYTFLCWKSGDTAITGITAEMYGDLELVAEWRKTTYEVTLKVTGEGKVKKDGTEAEARFLVANGAELKLVAEAAGDNEFGGWKVNGEERSGIELRIESVERDYEIEAEFIKKTYTIIVENGTGGKAYESGEEAVLKAGEAPLGYKFAGWTKDGGSEVVSAEEEYRFTVSEGATYTATYAKIEYKITYNAGEGASGGSGNITSYTIGTEYSLEAPTREGYNFKGWYAGGRPVSGITAEMYGDLELVAEWEKASYDITINITGKGKVKDSDGTEVGSHSAANGAELELVAEAVSGYKFAGWYVNGSKVEGTDLKITADQDMTIEARFEKSGGSNTWWIVLVSLAGGALVISGLTLGVVNIKKKSKKQ